MTILNDIKRMLGILSDNLEFDPELVLFISSAFSDLELLGMANAPTITATTNWPDRIPAEIKEFVYLRARLSFDPPQNGFTTTSFQKRLDELAWRINVHFERFKNGVDTWA